MIQPPQVRSSGEELDDEAAKWPASILEPTECMPVIVRKAARMTSATAAEMFREIVMTRFLPGLGCVEQ